MDLHTLQAKAQSQEDALTSASVRIAELEERQAHLQQVLMSELGPLSAQASSLSQVMIDVAVVGTRLHSYLYCLAILLPQSMPTYSA